MLTIARFLWQSLDKILYSLTCHQLGHDTVEPQHELLQNFVVEEYGHHLFLSFAFFKIATQIFLLAFTNLFLNVVIIQVDSRIGDNFGLFRIVTTLIEDL